MFKHEKLVKVKVTMICEYPVPYDWEERLIEFHLEEKICAIDIIDYERQKTTCGCLCHLSEVEVIKP